MHNSTPQPLKCSLQKLSSEQLRESLKTIERLHRQLHSQLGMYEIHHALDSVDRELLMSTLREEKWGAFFDLFREAIVADVKTRVLKALAKREEEAA